MCRCRSLRLWHAAVDNVTTPSAAGLYHVNTSWRSFNPDQFQTDLQASALCDDRCWQGLDGDALGHLYDNTITRLLDQQVPAETKTCHRRPFNAWFDDEFRQAKRLLRTQERVARRFGPLSACQLYKHGDFNVDNTSVCCLTKRLHSGRLESMLISSIHAATGSPLASCLYVAAQVFL